MCSATNTTYGSNGDFETRPHDQIKCRLVCSWRFVVVIVAFVGAVLHATMRNMIGMTMVCMVNATDTDIDENDTIINDVSHLDDTIKIGTTAKCRPPPELADDYHHGEFEWTKHEQNFVISANAVGQLVGLSLAGFATHNFSSLWLMFVATLFGSIFTFIFPMAAHMGSNYAFYARVGVGVCTGISWPCIHTIIGRWCHRDELSYLNSLVSGGRQISVVVATPLAAFFCKQFNLWGGWPFNYYATAICSALWCVVWALLVADQPTPDHHRFLSEEESQYILKGCQHKERPKNIPYMKLLFAPAALSCTLAYATAMWAVYLMVYYLPAYLRDVLHMDLYSNGIYTGLPFLLQFFGKVAFSHAAELLIARGTLTRDAASRIFTVISLVGVGFFLIVTTFVKCDHTTLAIFMICLAMTVYSANGPGYLHSQLAICPPFRGIMSAIVNIMGTVSQLCVPYVVNLIVINNTVQEWRTVFIVGFVGQLFAAVVYCFFGSAQEQSWSYESQKKDKPAD